MYVFWHGLQALFQVQADLRGERSLLRREVIHTVVFIGCGDHRTDAHTVKRFINGQIFLARIFYFYQQTLRGFLNGNIYALFLAFQLCGSIDGIFKEVRDHDHQILWKNRNITAGIGQNLDGDTALVCPFYVHGQNSIDRHILAVPHFAPYLAFVFYKGAEVFSYTFNIIVVG